MTKKLIFILALFVFIHISGNVSATNNGSDIIIIRVFYYPLLKGAIKIYKSNDQVESIELPKYDNTDKENAFGILRNTINKYTSDGYSISSTTGSEGVYIYILEKK